MRLKYYKSTIYKEIKKLYFQHFKYLNIDDEIINQTFNQNILYMIKTLDINYFNFKKLIDDYFGLSKEHYIIQSDTLLKYENLLLTADEIINSNLSTEKENHPILNELISLLTDLSDESYLVGGAVRDMINGSELKDFDFVTDTPYNLLQSVLESHGYKAKQVGNKYLVLHVSKFEEQFEISNFRKDGVYLNGRRPETVEIGTIEDDAERRDFTCNSLYFDLKNNEILDPTGQGLMGVMNKKLNFIGKADNRIEEDYLRVFRGYRFMSKGYKASELTLKALRKNFDQACKRVSSERIMNEIERIVYETIKH